MSETQVRLDTQALDGTLINSKIAVNTITLDKLASIGDGKIIVGAVATGYPSAVTTVGDVTISDTGATLIGSGAVTGAKIASSTITNTNISSGDFSAITGIGVQDQALNMNSHKINSVTDPGSAQDAATKNYVDTSSISSTLSTGNILVGNLSNVAASVAMSSDVNIDHTGATTIQANAIVDSKVSATAAINITKLNHGTDAQIIISDGSTNNWKSVSGDIHITDLGATSIQSGVIVDSQVSATAAIALSKLADGTNILLADANKSIADTIRYTYGTTQTFVNAGDLVDKQYVDGVASGLVIKNSCRLGTIGSHLTSMVTEGPSYPTNGVGTTLTSTTNGAFVLDGFTGMLNDRILVKDQGELDLTITGFVSTNEIDVVDNTGVLAGDQIAQALQIDITNVNSGTQFAVSSIVGVNSGDSINQGSFYATVQSTGAGVINVNSTTGFTTGFAYDTTQRHYHLTKVTGTGGSTQIFVASNVGFYNTGGTGGDPHDAYHIYNGIYTLTQTGDGSHPWILTRAIDFDGSLPGGLVEPGDLSFITQGSMNATTSWVVTNTGFNPITVDTNDITWSQFGGGATYSAGNGLTLTGNQFSIVSDNGGIVSNAHSIALTLDGSTLSVGASGLKLSSLTSAYILVGNGSNIATGVAMSGDVAIDNTGLTAVTSSIPRYSSFVTREVPTGFINSSNRVYTLANTPTLGTECVYLNGLLQTAGVDYTISTNTITFSVGDAPETGSILVVNYMK